METTKKEPRTTKDQSTSAMGTMQGALAPNRIQVTYVYFFTWLLLSVLICLLLCLSILFPYAFRLAIRSPGNDLGQVLMLICTF